MKLWLLRPIDNTSINDNPWEPWYDKAFGFVIRAENEQEARELTDAEAGDEKHYNGKRTWLEPKYATCVELTAEGESGIIIKDYAAA